jgi:tetratricopeptide (TPR) repeat protein
MSIAKPSVQERILLHLFDYADFKSSIEVPFALSQMGIANAVAIARSNVPRAIAGLKDDGLLIERQAHVKGVSRKRKAYFLTDIGIKLAGETWTRLQSYPLRCILNDGTSVSTTLGTIKSSLPFEMRPVDVIRYLDDNGILDTRTLSADLIERDLSKHVEKQLVTSLTDLPRVRHFFGRNRELDNMESLLDARATTLLVPGIAGIGKTSVAAKLIERFMHRRNLLYHRCQEWEGSRPFFESVADWLSSIGDSSFADFLMANPHPSPADAAQMIIDGIEGAQSLIVIDDLHKVSDMLLHQTLQAITLALLGSEEKIGLVLFSRSFKPVVPAKDAEGRIASLFLPLEGLDSDAGRKLLSSYDGMEDEQWLYIHGLSRGHPLVLELINRGASPETFHETLENYVTVEIFSKLSAEQKRVLSAIAIYRNPATLSQLAQQGLDTDELDSLVDSGLARRVDKELYDVHDLIREFLLQSMPTPLKTEYHLKCLEWYRSQSNELHNVIETIYHAINSNQHEDASQYIIDHGKDLISQGYMELHTHINKIEFDSIDVASRIQILQLQGDLFSLLGRLDEAEAAFDYAISLCDSKSIESQANILSSLADVARKQGDLDLAMERHTEALEHYIKLKNNKLAARTYNNLGYLYRRKNDRNTALEAYAEVEKIVSDSDEESLLSHRLTLTRALIDLDEIERARDHALNCYERTQEIEDEKLHARAQSVLGRYYAKIGDSKLALHHYTSSLETMHTTGDVVTLVDITILLGEVLQDAGRKEEAMEQYREALVVAEANDLRMQIGELLTRLGGVTPDRQRRMEYLQRALAVYRELGASSKMKEVQTLVHRAVMGR